MNAAPAQQPLDAGLAGALEGAELSVLGRGGDAVCSSANTRHLLALTQKQSPVLSAPPAAVGMSKVLVLSPPVGR